MTQETRKGLPLFRANEELTCINKDDRGGLILCFNDVKTGKRFTHGRPKGSINGKPQHRISHINGEYEQGYYIVYK